MKTIWRIAAVSLLGVLPGVDVRAEPPARVKTEIDSLLHYVEGSGCRFLRNGVWYDSQTARAHLGAKYHHFAAGNLINSTEEFIDRAATQSMLTGEPYQAQCNGGATVAAKIWLGDELLRLRALER